MLSDRVTLPPACLPGCVIRRNSDAGISALAAACGLHLPGEDTSLSTPVCAASGRKHRALRPQKPLRLIRDGEVGWSGIIFIPYTYSLRYHHQNDSALRWAAV